MADSTSFIDERNECVFKRYVFENFDIIYFGLFRYLPSSLSWGKEYL